MNKETTPVTVPGEQREDTMEGEGNPAIVTGWKPISEAQPLPAATQLEDDLHNPHPDEKFDAYRAALLEDYELLLSKYRALEAELSRLTEKIRVNDRPPSHWSEKDGWTRHPQLAEEWNWHNDPAGEGSKRSELRLNFAGDRADPHAPDQMALILRIDLLRIMARMQSAEAFKASRLAHCKPVQFFIAYPDSRWVKDVGGKWMKATEPTPPISNTEEK